MKRFGKRVWIVRGGGVSTIGRLELKTVEKKIS